MNGLKIEYQPTEARWEYNVWVFVNDKTAPWSTWKYDCSWEMAQEVAQYIQENLVGVDPYYLAVAILPVGIEPPP